MKSVNAFLADLADALDREAALAQYGPRQRNENYRRPRCSGSTRTASLSPNQTTVPLIGCASLEINADG